MRHVDVRIFCDVSSRLRNIIPRVNIIVAESAIFRLLLLPFSAYFFLIIVRFFHAFVLASVSTKTTRRVGGMYKGNEIPSGTNLFFISITTTRVLILIPL